MADETAALAALVLDEETRRHAAQGRPEREYTDDELMVVGDDVTLAAAFRQGGASLLAALMAVGVVQSLDTAALGVLAPDIQASLGVSSGVLGAIGGAAGVLFVMGSIPIAVLADRRRRTTIAGVCTFVYALLSIATAAVGNAFWLFAARMGSGLAASHILPVHNSLLADAYPIRGRGRIYSIYGLGTPIGQLLGPLVVGGIAGVVGGVEGWRWAFVAVGVPALGLAVLVGTRREPRRGMNEQIEVLGETIEAERSPVPTSTAIAFGRLRQINTFRFLLVGIGALGFGLFSVPIFLNIYLQDTFGLSALGRGVVGSIVVVPSLVALPLAGRLNDRLFRASPPRSLVLCAGLISLFGVFVTLALFMPNLASFVAVLALGTMCANAGFMLIGPIVAAVVPYRLRTQGYAMVGVYVFLSGAFLGAVLAGLMSDAWGVRPALSLLCVPSALIGGALLASGAAHIRGDIGRVMEELEEERAEATRVRDHDAEDHVLQVRNLDFSYGTVQVLFGVDLDVRRGEVLALLGTNGAGKSTLLRCICGLGVPSRGTIRLHGHTITYAEPEHRVQQGIVMMPGGNALWDPLTVEENLRLGAFLLRNDDRERQRRLDQVLARFPELRERLGQQAGTLSGGQKQMVALAKAMLLEPEVLLIDELSLGLSPIAAQGVLAKVEELRDQGLTIVIVEQSVNVALSIADRAVFMEKGQVRFDGAAADLLERGDLLRVVFLGGADVCRRARSGSRWRRVTVLGVVTFLGVDLNPQDLFDGAVTGLVYGFLAIGVILLHRASGIVNFAYGAIGSLAAVLVAKMLIDWNWPFLPALVVGVAASAAISGAIEMTVVRRLFDSARSTLFVATIGVAQLVTVVVISVPRVEGTTSAFPTLFEGSWQLGGVTVQAPQILALVTIPLVALALGWFLNRTIWGIGITAAAANPDATRLAGLSTRKVSTLVWVLAGALAGITTVLAAPLRSTPVANLAQASGIQLLVIALAVALLARMRSMVVAVVAGVAVGIVERVVFYNWANQAGLVELLLFATVLGGVVLARRGASGDAGAWALSSRIAPLPDRLRSHLLVRRLPWVPAIVGLVGAVAIPLVLDTNARYFLFSRLALVAIVVISVTVLTGWAGQLSLAQFALAGVGAMTMAGADRHLNLQFLPALALAIAVCVAAAVIMGIPSFRVRGMYLAIVTLAFANAAYAWLFHQWIFTGGRDAARYEPDHLRIGSLDLTDNRTFYFVCLGALVVVMLLANRLRRSGVGRALVAVRDNEPSAAAFTIAPRARKLSAFALAGGLAGFAGALLMALLTNARADQFPVDLSLSAVSMAVIGGLASVAGAVLGTLWVVGLPSAFDSNETVSLLTSGVGLLVLIMYFPGGLVQVAYAFRGWIVRAIDRRLPPADARSAPVRLTASTPRGRRDDVEAAPAGAPDLAVKGLRVSFGARTVVDGVDLHVGRNEVVGLIGANGAGKTTIMNAIGGFVPADGRVELLGRDISSLSAARRAERGLGRSFQDARLFGDLTVLETVALAHERVLPTRMLEVLSGIPTWRRRDREQLARARELVDHLGLGGFADHFVGTLSTGTRRICELACILALEPRVICLDEPTAGVAQRETEAFAPLITRIQADLGASLLVIEHDMPFVLSISDRVYCLETGAIIAEGPPERVRHDPRVVASYLGTDERAINRSGAAVSPEGVPAPATTSPATTSSVIPTTTGSS